ncbi:hypothetical protein LWE61_15505 [Sphingobium sufflavum]|uniref:hypothetical protein n=1 Tax=Sphingobium sufflavum TaxID=1129547 RepID=UPI001F2CE080|nr:hypothetical protein [Sphingobium sufflavum]MCE7797955.1 hypothetical protein [Sphingobium sufflavum]
MRLKSALALGLMVPLGGAVLLAAPANAAKKEEQAAAPSLKPSPAFVKVYVEADKALKAKDFATAQTQITAAEAAATTPDDKYLTGSLWLNLGLGQQNEATQRKGIEQMLASGKAGQADVAKFSFFAGQFALKAKDYDPAVKYFNDSITAGYPGSSAHVMLAETYFGKAYQNVAGNQLNPAGKQLAIQGLGALKKAIEVQAAAGQPVEGGWYTRGFQMSALASAPDAAFWSSQALKTDPKPENWRIALRTYQDGHKTMTRDENLDLLRLMQATGALKEAYSYGEYVDAAMKGGLFGEAKSVIEGGRASGNLGASQLADVYQVASNGIASDKASLPASEASAAKAANGRLASSTASAYYGYGNYAKAITLYRLALQKGGVDANEVNTRLGIALLKSGDVAGAKAAFATVTTPGIRKDIADLWSVWLSSKAA